MPMPRPSIIIIIFRNLFSVSFSEYLSIAQSARGITASFSANIIHEPEPLMRRMLFVSRYSMTVLPRTCFSFSKVAFAYTYVNATNVPVASRRWAIIAAMFQFVRNFFARGICFLTCRSRMNQRSQIAYMKRKSLMFRVFGVVMTAAMVIALSA